MRTGSPRTTSCGRSRGWRHGSPPFGSTARTTGTAACPWRLRRSPSEQVIASAEATAGATLDDYCALVGHLSRLHPSRYGALVDGVTAVHLLDVAPAADQNVALRLVVLADRLYDRQVPVVSSGIALDQLFGADMMAGGYRKKYRRALSRLLALSRPAASLGARRAG